MLDELFYKGNYGIERETPRVDKNGKIAKTPHPFEDNDENITRDLCDNQIEIITPVCSSIDEVMQSLANFDNIVRTKLAENGETLWLYSNSPHYESENDIAIAKLTGKLLDKKIYYEKVAKKYGKKNLFLSGIHFNFSFDDKYLHTIYKGNDFETFKGEYYLKICKQFSIYSWLLVILTAASPICDKSFFVDGEKGIINSGYSSIRNGKQGFWNKFVPILNYDSLEKYTNSIQRYIDDGILYAASEIYLPIRIKSKGKYTLNELIKGVSHIEFRLFDINPLQPLGIDKYDLEFTHFLIMYLSTLDDFDFTPELQKQAIENHKNAALYELSKIEIDGVNILKRAKQIIEDMMTFFEGDSNAINVLEYECAKLNNRLCTQLDEKLAKMYDMNK